MMVAAMLMVVVASNSSGAKVGLLIGERKLYVGRYDV